jgi:hypothetical protein
VLPLSVTFVGMLFNLRIWLPFFSLAHHFFHVCAQENSFELRVVEPIKRVIINRLF